MVVGNASSSGAELIILHVLVRVGRRSLLWQFSSVLLGFSDRAVDVTVCSSASHLSQIGCYFCCTSGTIITMTATPLTIALQLRSPSNSCLGFLFACLASYYPRQCGDFGVGPTLVPGTITKKGIERDMPCFSIHLTTALVNE